MVRHKIAGGVALFFALMCTPLLSVAQPVPDGNASAASAAPMPRLSLPVAQENYPADAYIAGEEGSVVLVATISTDGQMSNARVETSSGFPSLDEAAVALANASRLPTPPTNAAGEPVSVDVLVDVNWELPAQPSQAASATPGVDDLPLDPTSAFALAYVRPGADFSGYDKIIFEGPVVELTEGWRRQNPRATLNDIDQLKSSRAQWFRAEFVKALETEGGYQIVSDRGEGVLIIRAGVGDLDVAAPFLASDIDPGFSLSESGTSATVILELYDGASGRILARFFDRQRTASANFDTPATRFSNEKDARVLFTGWAQKLRERLQAGR